MTYFFQAIEKKSVFLEDCANILNEEWPRSTTARYCKVYTVKVIYVTPIKCFILNAKASADRNTVEHDSFVN
jgi:hypothetical protein